MTDTPENTGTRERIIDAAGELFAAHGFRNATVRDICSLAGVNVAAVNYHFRDKETLYGEVLRHLHQNSVCQYPIDMGVAQGASAEDCLAAFVRSFLHRLLDEGRPAWHGKLMAMEMADPTPALDELVELSILPMFKALEEILRDLLGPDAPESEIEQCGGSIIGQCLHYKHARPVIVRMGLWRLESVDQVAALADHIVQFSLGGIARLRAQRGASPQPEGPAA